MIMLSFDGDVNQFYVFFINLIKYNANQVTGCFQNKVMICAIIQNIVFIQNV